jgi:hypothetical protein
MENEEVKEKEQKEQKPPETQPPPSNQPQPYPQIPPPPPQYHPYPPPQYPYYYPPQPPPPPPPIYSWEMYPHVARELMRPKRKRSQAFALIGIFLLITFALEFPIAGLLMYYASAEEVDFGGTLTLTGEVKAEDGSAVSGATIVILGTDLITISDSDGEYSIENAPSGIWHVMVSRSGYKDEEHKVLLERGFSDTLNFELEQGSGKTEENGLWFFFSLAILMMMFSTFVFAGSYYSFNNRRFAVVLVGAVMGIFTMTAPFVFGFSSPVFALGSIGMILSLSALLMAIANRKAFSPTEHTDEQRGDKVPPQNGF